MAASRRIGAAFASAIVALSLALSPAAPAASAAEWKDSTIKPGETIALERVDTPPHSPARIAENSTLPAGWSVWSQSGTIRVAAPANAQPGDTAQLTMEDNGQVTDEVKVTVEGTTAASTTTTSSGTSWLDGFLSSLNRLFS